MKLIYSSLLLVLPLVACVADVQLLEPTRTDASSQDGSSTPTDGGNSQVPSDTSAAEGGSRNTGSCYWPANANSFYQPLNDPSSCGSNACLYQYALDGTPIGSLSGAVQLDNILVTRDDMVVVEKTTYAGPASPAGIWAYYLDGRSPELLLEYASGARLRKFALHGSKMLVALGTNSNDSVTLRLASANLAASNRTFTVHAQTLNYPQSDALMAIDMDDARIAVATFHAIYTFAPAAASPAYETFAVDASEQVASLAVSSQHLYWTVVETASPSLKEGLSRRAWSATAAEVLVPLTSAGANNGRLPEVAYAPLQNVVLYNDGVNLFELSNLSATPAQRVVYNAGAYVQGFGRISGLTVTDTGDVLVGDLCDEDADSPGYSPRKIDLNTGAMHWLDPRQQGPWPSSLPVARVTPERNSNYAFRIYMRGISQ